MFELQEFERQPCEVWSRVMGYCRPVSSWNIGKKGEFAERKYFTEKSSARLIHGDATQ
jgi:hypothetical protein